MISAAAGGENQPQRGWRIAEADLERVKRETDLVALVRGRGVELKKHGSKDFVGKCPFHQDIATGNFIVSPQKGLWHCMACGLAGNAIQLVQRFDGISFRHAFEVLAHGGTAGYTAPHDQAGPVGRSKVPRLECPLDPAADDQTLMGQVLDYYHGRLMESAPALEYLEKRGLRDDIMLRRFKMGLADRTLGMRLPEADRVMGAELRTRLMQLGVWRESGHEHFNGCIVTPIFNEAGAVAELYGRRFCEKSKSMRHLYLPGPHGGIFNHEAAFAGSEVILCESVFDALTFYKNGIINVTTIFGTEGFSDEIFAGLIAHKVRVVRLAYDADEAGERAATRDSARLKAHGIEVYRIKFPWGMDANDFACKVQPAAKSLPLLLGGAQWIEPIPTAEPALPQTPAAAAASPPAAAEPLSGNPDALSVEALACAPARSSSLLVAELAAETVAKKESFAAAVAVPTPPPTPTLSERDSYWFLPFEEREYRMSGLDKCLGSDSLKLTLRLKWREYFHSDQLDLCRDADRRRFVERAVEETGLTPDLLKRDLGRLLLATEQHQQAKQRAEKDAAKGASEQGPAPMSPEDEAEALAFLQAEDLLGKIGTAFEQCGIVGETNNKLTAYLAGVSRKLERPLAIIIQSTSAAGKSSLMDAVLSFFPEEDRIKFSAMTGQSLYYLGETNLKHKILAIVEEEGAEKASYALKLLQSEGELIIASTGKDPHTGRMVTQQYRVEGPVMIFLTTTAIEIDEELQNRCLTLTVDESPEQTARIHALQRQKRTLAGLIAKEERKDLLRVLRNAQRLLKPIEILNPFAPKLTFESGRTRTRRDHEKYLTLIDSLALLHQHQRPRGSHTVNGRVVEYIEVTIEDIETANRLATDVLGRSLDELPPQTRRLYGNIRELVRGLMEKNAQPQSRSHFSRRQLRDQSGWSEPQVRVHLQRLEELEYVARRFGRQGASCLYELLLPVEIEDGPYFIGLLDVEKLRNGKNL
jgi:DNA primase